MCKVMKLFIGKTFTSTHIKSESILNIEVKQLRGCFGEHIGQKYNCPMHVVVEIRTTINLEMMGLAIEVH